jgi:iron complex transport system permease protein
VSLGARAWIVLIVALLVAITFGVAAGAVSLPFGDVLRALTGQGTPRLIAIVRDLRLPRALLGALVGAGLGASGAALQGAMRNPLAEPYLLGVSGGAAVGGVVAFALGLTAAGLLPLAAFGGAAAAVVLVLAVARAAAGGTDGRLLVMAGVVVGAFANAAIMVALSSAPADRVRGALWWMMGSTADADWPHVVWLAVYLVPGLAALWWMARDIDLLALGEEPAAALGVDVDRSGRRVYVTASLVAASTVAAAGLIGFVGLVVPHLVRRLGATSHRPLVAASAVAGAALVVLADVVARSVVAPIELPLGAVTALVGVPFFLVRLGRAR